ncbi:MAG: DUF29 domain-containing protein [Burkholderiales bacterium]
MADNFRHLHDRDFAEWALKQAKALRAKRFDEVDCAILANELERLISRERSEINTRLEALTVQLLMWTVQPATRTEAFQSAILDQRNSLDSLLKSSPSLRGAIEVGLPRTYSSALATAEEAGIPRSMFPAEPVFTLEQLVDRAFWPASLFGGRAFSF